MEKKLSDMTTEEKRALITKRKAEFKKEMDDNLILSKDVERPKQRLGIDNFESNLYRYYQKDNPPQFEADDYKEGNIIYLGRFNANGACHKENHPELEEIDLFVARYDDEHYDWTVGYRYGELGDVTANKHFIGGCPAFNEAAIRALNLNIISIEEYMEALFWSTKDNIPYFVKAVLKKHGDFDKFLREYIKESKLPHVDENAETLEDKQETSMFDDVLAIKDLSDKMKR